MIEILIGALVIVALTVVFPAYAYVLLGLKSHMTDINTKTALTNTMLAQYNINMLLGESNEIAEAKASEMLAAK